MLRDKRQEVPREVLWSKEGAVYTQGTQVNYLHLLLCCNKYAEIIIPISIWQKGQECGRPAGHPGKRVGGREQHVPRGQERHAQSRRGGEDKSGSQVWILISMPKIMAAQLLLISL